MRILVTRPEHDSLEFAAALRLLGHEPILSPALVIEQLNGPSLDLTPFQSILITSSNAVRALANRHLGRSDRLLCGGPSSAQVAKSLGFYRIDAASGEGVDGLVDLVTATLKPNDGPLLHVSGADVAGDLAQSVNRLGYTMHREVLYRANLATKLVPQAATLLANGDIAAVTFFSARSVQGFLGACRADGLEENARKLTAYCLSHQIAEFAKPNFQTTKVGSKLTARGMLDALAQP
jgi:uroporphyrinogen-III synthase